MVEQTSSVQCQSSSEQPHQPAWSRTDLQADPHAAPDKAARVQKMFASIAHRYDLNNRVHSLGRDQAWRRKAVRLCEIRPTDDVLDVACGTGDLTLAFAAACPPPRSVTGLDFTEEMLHYARQKESKRRDGGSKVSFVQGDAMNLPFADSSFDAVSIAFGIRNVAEPQTALREFRRVLRDGGRLVVLEFSQPRNALIRAMNSLYTRGIMPMTASIVAGDRSGAYRYLPKSVATFPEGEQFIQLLETCGFQQISAYPMTFGVCTAYLAHR